MLKYAQERNLIDGGLKRGIVQRYTNTSEATCNKVKVKLVDFDVVLEQVDVMTNAAYKKGSQVIGNVRIPHDGEEVLVGFLDGDIAQPVIIGSLYSQGITPPVNILQKENEETVFLKFPSNLEIVINSAKGKEQVNITTKNGNIINLDESKEQSILTVTDKNKKTHFKMDFTTGKGTIEIKAEKKIGLIAGKESIIIEDGKGINVNSTSGNVKISAQKNVNVNATTNFACSATSAKIEAKSAMNIKGTSVAVNAQGIASFKGQLTQIN